MITSIVKNVSIACVAAAFVGAIGTANAAPIFYDDSAAFDTATSGFTMSLDDLNSRASGALPSDLGGLDITTNNSGSISSNRIRTTTASGGTSIKFTFSTAINAFGIDVNDLATFGETTFTVALSTGGSLDYILPDVSNGLDSFYGVIDTGLAFTSVTLTNSRVGDVVYYDNVQSGTAPVIVVGPGPGPSPGPSAVSEPGTLALFGLGLVGLGFARRRKTA
jgi:hypothetical protein